MVPSATATEPIVCAVPLAKTAPAAPAETAGRAGMAPIVMRAAAIIDIVFGYSLMSSSKAIHDSMSHKGALTISSVAEEIRIISRACSDHF